jgi:hypothetical protein
VPWPPTKGTPVGASDLASSALETTAVVRGISLGAVYVIVGVVVAAVNDYFDDLDTLKQVGEALIAVLIWPLILFGVDVNLS